MQAVGRDADRQSNFGYAGSIIAILALEYGRVPKLTGDFPVEPLPTVRLSTVVLFALPAGFRIAEFVRVLLNAPLAEYTILSLTALHLAGEAVVPQ